MNILKKVKQIEISTKGLVDGLLQGAYQSKFKGQGIEFAEVREYSPGDDIRIIDWNVTSRMNTPYVKEFIEERDLTVYILFDVSSSNEFGFEQSKKDKAIEIAASLMFAALRNNDQVGLCLFSEQVETFIPAKKGRKHVFQMIHTLLEHKPKYKTTNLANSLTYLNKVLKRRCTILMLSDFMDQNYEKPLSILGRRHDTIALTMHDIRESEIPDVGYVHMEDEETGEQILVNTSDPEFRKNYAQILSHHHAGLQTTFTHHKIDSIRFRSDQHFEVPLRKFFGTRSGR